MMLEMTADRDIVTVYGAAQVPHLLVMVSDQIADTTLTDRAPAPLAGFAAETSSEDPLARLEVDDAAQQLATALETARDRQDRTARDILMRWVAGSRGDVFTDTLSSEEVADLAGWANRRYQAARIAELDAAGVEAVIGSSCGVDQLLAELVGPSPDSSESVEMTPTTMLFAYLVSHCTAAARDLSANRPS